MRSFLSLVHLWGSLNWLWLTLGGFLGKRISPKIQYIIDFKHSSSLLFYSLTYFITLNFISTNCCCCCCCCCCFGSSHCRYSGAQDSDKEPKHSSSASPVFSFKQHALLYQRTTPAKHRPIGQTVHCKRSCLCCRSTRSSRQAWLRITRTKRTER